MYLIIDKQKLLIKNANTFIKKLKGLLGIKNLTYGMFFWHTNSIHTIGMKTNIDVIAINNNNIVIAKYENVPKNKIIIIHNSIKNTNILELPPFKSKNININDQLSFINK